MFEHGLRSIVTGGRKRAYVLYALCGVLVVLVVLVGYAVLVRARETDVAALERAQVQTREVLQRAALLSEGQVEERMPAVEFGAACTQVMQRAWKAKQVYGMRGGADKALEYSIREDEREVEWSYSVSGALEQLLGVLEDVNEFVQNKHYVRIDLSRLSRTLSKAREREYVLAMKVVYEKENE